MKKYLIKTFGCQMNYSDSERISACLEKMKLKKVSNINDAGLVVFNTCGVRQMAEDRVYGQIHNLKQEAQNEKRKVVIILTGCLANRKDVRRRLKSKVDLFTEIKDFNKDVKTLLKESGIAKPESVLKKPHDSSFMIHDSAPDKERIAYLATKPKYESLFSVYVPIMTGCNNFCAYCVVPHARGREISRPSGEIISEVRHLAGKGYKEIILLGQNVNSYKDGNTNFSKLLKKVNAIPGKFWIFFISNHPKDVTDEMIETVTKCKKVCEYFHLPVQSGSDEIIERMNRKYTSKHYLKLIRKIKSSFRKHKPNIPFAITSDIIVGFPGESRKQFQNSAKVMETAEYDMVYFGQYSPRPETVAWKMKDNVSKKEKVRREKFLNEILKKTNFANNKKYIGKVFEVLVEKQTPANLGTKSPNGDLVPKKQLIYFGKTRTLKNVKFSATEKGLIGKFVKVKITKANVWSLAGEIEK